MAAKKLGIFVVARRVSATLIPLIERLPNEIKEKAAEIFVFDNCSDDGTYQIGLDYKAKTKNEKLTLFRNERDLGYGGNQKAGYSYALKNNFDIVVMLHGDLQYPPEKIPELIAPLYAGEADAVFGSRILGGNPLLQGMPLWKYLGNRFLTFVENRALDTNLTEFHSGFRAYSCDALKRLPIAKLTDNYHFDTEIIVEMRKAGMKIKEIPIPTHYGPESRQISFTKSIKYGLDILKIMRKYRAEKSKRS